MGRANSRDVTILIRRLTNLLDSIIDTKDSISSPAPAHDDERAVHDIIIGRTHPDVSKINNILESIRRKYVLFEGSDRNWTFYANDAIKSIRRSNVCNEITSPPPHIPISIIESRFIAPTPAQPDLATFQIVSEVDPIRLPMSRRASNAIVQVASQFNFLESQTPAYTALEDYIVDTTQGPRASLSSFAALYLRDKFFKYDDPNASFFKSILPERTDAYTEGHLMPNKLSSEERAAVADALRENIKSLRILAQWGIPDVGESSNRNLQVFTAAPSFKDQPTPEEGTDSQKICTILVEAQYKAIAQIAAARSLETVTRTPLHLTLVGQGVFNNPPSVMAAALDAVYQTVRKFNVNVYIHGHSAEDVKLIQNSVPILQTTPAMTSEEFFRAR